MSDYMKNVAKMFILLINFTVELVYIKLRSYGFI